MMNKSEIELRSRWTQRQNSRRRAHKAVAVFIALSMLLLSQIACDTDTGKRNQYGQDCRTETRHGC